MTVAVLLALIAASPRAEATQRFVDGDAASALDAANRAMADSTGPDHWMDPIFPVAVASSRRSGKAVRLPEAKSCVPPKRAKAMLDALFDERWAEAEKQLRALDTQVIACGGPGGAAERAEIGTYLAFTLLAAGRRTAARAAFVQAKSNRRQAVEEDLLLDTLHVLLARTFYRDMTCTTGVCSAPSEQQIGALAAALEPFGHAEWARFANQPKRESRTD